MTLETRPEILCFGPVKENGFTAKGVVYLLRKNDLKLMSIVHKVTSEIGLFTKQNIVILVK